jgi:hypothetical protein
MEFSMKTEEIVSFKEYIKNKDVDELNTIRNHLNDQISKMILDSELIMKVAIIEEYLREKLTEEKKHE